MITTGSGLERFMNCRASSVLHRAWDAAGDRGASYGTEAHAFLQRIGEGISREASLEEVDERFRDGISSIDVDDLVDVLGLTPELALAYHPATDTARVLGAGLGRAYEAAGVADDEVPLTVDVAGLDSPQRPSVGFVGDFKTGWSRLTPAAFNWQMRGGALALARAFDLDAVRVQLIHLREDRPAFRDRATFTSADLAAFAAEAGARHELAVAERKNYRMTREEPDATIGSWCRYCPSYHACSAQTALIKRIADVDQGEQLDAEAIAVAYRRVRAARAGLKRIDKQIHAAAARSPVLIEVMPDGTEMWLGETTVTDHRKLDPDIARAVLREMLDDQAADEASKHEVGIGRIEAVVKRRVPRGYAASKVRAILEEIDRRGGVHRPTRQNVALFPLRRALPPNGG